MTIPWRTILCLAAVACAVLVLLSVGEATILLAVAVILVAVSVLA